MKKTTLQIETGIDSLAKITTNIVKLGTLIGAFFVTMYCLRIDHFPQDLSLGDGLLLLLAGGAFGAVYVFFLVCHIALGTALFPVTKFICKAIVALPFLRFAQKEHLHRFTPFSWQSLPFAFVAVLLIYLMGRNDPILYWLLPLWAVALHIFYSVFSSCGDKIRILEGAQNSIVHNIVRAPIDCNQDIETLKNTRIATLAVIVIAPLVASGIYGQILDSAMRLANVRLESPTIYLKDPYLALLPKNLISKTQRISKDYVAFEGAKVFFKGFGKTTIISFADGTVRRQLEIPNDQIIVENR